jgi:hypothetical protein
MRSFTLSLGASFTHAGGVLGADDADADATALTAALAVAMTLALALGAIAAALTLGVALGGAITLADGAASCCDVAF